MLIDVIWGWWFDVEDEGMVCIILLCMLWLNCEFYKFCIVFIYIFCKLNFKICLFKS